MIKRRKLFFVVLMSAIGLAGCWGSKEIDEAAYALALGIDTGPGKNLIVSVALDNPGGSGAGPGSAGRSPSPERIRVFSAQAPTIVSALNIINSQLERQIELGHLKTVVLGEPIARQEIGPLMETMVRWRKFRRTIYIGVAQGEARRVVENLAPPAGDNAARFIELIFIAQGFTGYTPRNQMLSFYNALKTKGEDPVAALMAPHTFESGPTAGPKAEDMLNIVFQVKTKDPGAQTAGNPSSAGNSSVQLLGTAVFRKDRMVQELTGNETIGLSLIRGEFRRAFVSVPEPGGAGRLMQLEISQKSRPKIRLVKKGRRIRAIIKLFLLGDIIGVQSGRQYESPRRLCLLEKTAGRWVEGQCRSVFRKAQTAGADIFGFGNYARWMAPDWPSWQKWDWEASFRRMTLDLRAEVRIDRSGLILWKNAVREE